MSSGPPNKRLHAAVSESSSAVLPVAAAKCERGFSRMNIIMTPARNSLLVSTIAALMFVKLVGPPLELFKPDAYVLTWLAQGHHSADDLNSKDRLVLDEDNDNSQLWALL